MMQQYIIEINRLNRQYSMSLTINKRFTVNECITCQIKSLLVAIAKRHDVMM